MKDRLTVPIDVLVIIHEQLQRVHRTYVRKVGGERLLTGEPVVNIETFAATFLRNGQRLILDSINVFSEQYFLCFGGREGSGMGSVLEALYLFNANAYLLIDNAPMQLALVWNSDHQYNDYVCVDRNEEWNPELRNGELFGIEVKAMISAADEAKAHFDVLEREIGLHDQLLVLAWSWQSTERGDRWVYPRVNDAFLGNAREIARYRDALHVIRGGSFVTLADCPDDCAVPNCTHVGEPLNANGKRERRSGPDATRVSQNTSHAQNFGGLKRMLAARNQHARIQREQALIGNNTATEFVDFVDRNFRDLIA